MKSQLMLSCGLACVLILSAGCGGGGSSSSAPSAVTTTGQFHALKFTLTAPKRTYKQGENVPLHFTVKNTGTEVFNYATSYGSDFLVKQGSRIVFRQYSGGAGGVATARIAAGETQTYAIGWPLRDNGGKRDDLGTPVGAGKYSVRVFMESVSPTVNFGGADMGGTYVGGTNYTITDAAEQLSAGPLEIEVR